MKLTEKLSLTIIILMVCLSTNTNCSLKNLQNSANLSNLNETIIEAYIQAKNFTQTNIYYPFHQFIKDLNHDYIIETDENSNFFTQFLAKHVCPYLGYIFICFVFAIKISFASYLIKLIKNRNNKQDLSKNKQNKFNNESDNENLALKGRLKKRSKFINYKEYFNYQEENDKLLRTNQEKAQEEYRKEKNFEDFIVTAGYKTKAVENEAITINKYDDNDFFNNFNQNTTNNSNDKNNNNNNDNNIIEIKESNQPLIIFEDAYDGSVLKPTDFANRSTDKLQNESEIDKYSNKMEINNNQLEAIPEDLNESKESDLRKRLKNSGLYQATLLSQFMNTDYIKK